MRGHERRLLSALANWKYDVERCCRSSAVIAWLQSLEVRNVVDVGDL